MYVCMSVCIYVAKMYIRIHSIANYMLAYIQVANNVNNNICKLVTITHLELACLFISKPDPGCTNESVQR